MKTCTKCGEDKTRDAFYKQKRNKDGLFSICKVCILTYSKKYREANPDKVKACHKGWREANPDKVKAYKEGWREANPDKVKANQKKWREANPDKVRAKNKKYYEDNKEWYASYQRLWGEANRDKVASIAAKRRAAKIERTPPWLTDQHYLDILAYYTQAKELTQTTGEQHHVDHIVPLQGENVSGLHVPWNLQVLTATDNISKGNSYEDGNT